MNIYNRNCKTTRRIID